jgi:hypothetical protein
MNLLGQASLISGIQVLLYVLIPAWVLCRWQWRDFGEGVFAFLLAGVCSVALLGRVGNAGGWGVPVVLPIWLAFWLGWGIWVWWRKYPVVSLPWDGLLLAILLLAWVVRMIHPLQTWALGQSDAYSHLEFLQNVLTAGRVLQPDYPPAYAWVQALPAWLLQGHPYWLARFGGALFGVGLVLGCYALWAGIRYRVAGVAAAALVAGCPFFFLLQKTGVGCFANQLGLMLIPAALWAYLTGRRGWLLVALATLAVAVPMMLLHVLLLLCGLLLVEREKGLGRFRLLVWLGLALLLVIGLALQLPPLRGRVIVAMLTGQYELIDVADLGWPEIFRLLWTDFWGIKRLGYSSVLLNGMAAGSLLVFVSALAWGWRQRDAAWRLVGVWGLLTSINVHLGCMQFTNYQREGWSLLLVVAGLCALLFAEVWQRVNKRALRGALGASLTIAALAGLLFPPAHVPLGGETESDVVRYLVNADPEITILTRNMSSFSYDQGDIARTLHPKAVRSVADLPIGGTAIFLRDYPPAEPTVSRVMQLLQPTLTAECQRVQRMAEEANQQLEQQLAGYVLSKETYSPRMEIWHVRAKH